jgi:acyl carrier protein phosphodiesterase
MLMPYMIDQNWLLSYQTIEGINNILTQMDGRTKNKSKMRFATEELRELYTEFEEDFTDFFDDLRACVQKN